MGFPQIRAFVEHTKVAFGPNEANRLLAVIKKHQVSASAVPSLFGPMHATLPKPSLMGVARARHIDQAISNHNYMLDGAFRKHMVPEELAAAARAQVAESMTALKGWISRVAPKGAVIQGGPVTMATEAAGRKAHLPVPPRPPADQRKMLESVIKGHEFDESQVRPRMAFKNFGHNSPDVVLREHNRLATLPEAYAPVRDYLRELRKNVESPALAQYGIDFGKSGRLSRHARKRITEDMEQRFRKMVDAL